MANGQTLMFVKTGRIKFVIGGIIIIAAIIYLIVASTQANSQYYMTVQELLDKKETMIGKEARISGAVIGETIQFDAQNLTLAFTIAQVPGDMQTIDANGGIAAVLHNAVLDSNLPHLKVIYHGVKPDLLKNEAQAIMSGKLDNDGIFNASELLLKCPTKYENVGPEQPSDNPK